MSDLDGLWPDDDYDPQEFSDHMECNSLMHAELAWPEGPWM
jgi:hypothetical protein